ncbi:DUF4314 domain-containing protein [Hespellia stercorisuis]|uniref:DUF4314 domain-containing protein n=1 Tax=Hespellia stercorisuis DSM 15480 TaxID=1121950 RepID=A0A1M6WC39_9FIRM|nr:DUF4314 domain-containing protein [Hespellia stercorisuis]SHK91055.1 hypothetical protein SAMN02745243_03978 [Hespellia stercorisuis DSM 15480]
MDREKMRVEGLRKRYPVGTMLCLNSMEGEPQMPAGLKGKVFCVDDIGQIHVEWENGSSLALEPKVDSFHKVDEPEKKKEKGEPSR